MISWISGMLARGEIRPEWCRLAISTDRGSLAAHSFFGDSTGTLVGGDRPVLAEIGVVASRRGRHHVDQLLAYATAKLAQVGAPQIRDDVDAANAPMRAAFRRTGFHEFAVHQDYRWTGSPTS